MSTDKEANHSRLSPAADIDVPIPRKKPRLNEDLLGSDVHESSVTKNDVNVSINPNKKNEEAKKGEVQYESTDIVVDNEVVKVANKDDNKDVNDTPLDCSALSDEEEGFESYETFGLQEGGSFFIAYRLMKRVIEEFKFEVPADFLNHMSERIPKAVETLRSIFLPTTGDTFFTPHTEGNFFLRAAEVHHRVEKFLNPGVKKSQKLNLAKVMESLFTINSMCSFLIGFCDCLNINLFESFRVAQLNGKQDVQKSGFNSETG